MRQVVNGFKLDKSHTFAVNMFDEIDKYMRIPDVYEPPEDKEFQPTVSPNFHTFCSCLLAATCVTPLYLRGVNLGLVMSAVRRKCLEHYRPVMALILYLSWSKQKKDPIDQL